MIVSWSNISSFRSILETVSNIERGHPSVNKHNFARRLPAMLQASSHLSFLVVVVRSRAPGAQTFALWRNNEQGSVAPKEDEEVH